MTRWPAILSIFLAPKAITDTAVRIRYLSTFFNKRQVNGLFQQIFYRLALDEQWPIVWCKRAGHIQIACSDKSKMELSLSVFIIGSRHIRENTFYSDNENIFYLIIYAIIFYAITKQFFKYCIYHKINNFFLKKIWK